MEQFESELCSVGDLMAFLKLKTKNNTTNIKLYFSNEYIFFKGNFLEHKNCLQIYIK